MLDWIGILAFEPSLGLCTIYTIQFQFLFCCAWFRGVASLTHHSIFIDKSQHVFFSRLTITRNILFSNLSVKLFGSTMDGATNASHLEPYQFSCSFLQWSRECFSRGTLSVQLFVVWRPKCIDFLSKMHASDLIWQLLHVS